MRAKNFLRVRHVREVLADGVETVRVPRTERDEARRANRRFLRDRDEHDVPDWDPDEE